MKKLVWIFSVIWIVFVSCNNRKVKSIVVNDEVNFADQSVNLENPVADSDAENDSSVKRVPPVYYSKGIPEKIDYDFTKMNFNMSSGLIFDIMVEPEKHYQKTIKIEGQFATSVYEGIRHFAVFTWDLAGCCPSGLEFIPSSTTDFLMNFPMEGMPITVIGRLEYGFNGVEDELYFMADEIKIQGVY